MTLKVLYVTVYCDLGSKYYGTVCCKSWNCNNNWNIGSC